MDNFILLLARMKTVTLLSQSDSTMTTWVSIMFFNFCLSSDGQLFIYGTFLAKYIQSIRPRFWAFFNFPNYYLFIPWDINVLTCVLIYIYLYICFLLYYCSQWWKLLPYIRSFHGRSTLKNPSLVLSVTALL